jgi:hypothetical protein
MIRFAKCGALLASLVGSCYFGLVLLASLVGCVVRYLYHWQARCYLGLVLLASLVGCAVRYLHHWQARCYIRLLLLVREATCIIGALGVSLDLANDTF